MQNHFYVGLDIASGPLELAEKSKEFMKISDCKTLQASALEIPLPASSLDAVVAIGSLHHTGDLYKSILEVERILKPGGIFVGMVYNLFSIRNWIYHPKTLLINLVKWNFDSFRADEKLRKRSDQNLIGQAAPATEYSSIRSLRKNLSNFENVVFLRENLDSPPIPIISGKIRKLFLKSFIARIGGLDIYFIAEKPHRFSSNSA